MSHHIGRQAEKHTNTHTHMHSHAHKERKHGHICAVCFVVTWDISQHLER